MNRRKLGVIEWPLGIMIALFGALVMWHGDIFGENNSGIATVMGMVGLALIAKGLPVWRFKKQ